MRPDFVPDANKNDEDIFSDEDIDREGTDIQTLLHTHSGNTKDNNEDKGIQDEATNEDARDAMNRASRIWTAHEENRRKRTDVKKKEVNFKKYAEIEMQQLKKETLKSQSQENNSIATANANDVFFESKGTYSEATLRHFVDGLREDNEDKSRRCNKEQKHIIEHAVNQIIQDTHYQLDRRRNRPQQFLRLLHGGLGTGKSHVIKILKEHLFEEELKWIGGVDFQIGVYQAMNVDNVDGDTLHHALGLQPLGARKKKGVKSDKDKKVAASQRIAQWKWLIIDEISMTSANF